MDYRVSVIIPARGRRELVKRAVISALGQALPPFEVIVVDDGSPSPLEVDLSSLESSQLVVLRYTPGVNAAFARNRGIDQATGEFIAFLDSDDWWRPNHLSHAVATLSESDAIAIASAYESDFGAGRKESLHRRETTIASGKNMLRYLFAEGGEVRTSTIVVRGEICSLVCFDEGLAKHQDWDFAVAIADYGRVHFDPCISVVVDRTASNRMSGKANPSATIRFLNKHGAQMGPDSRNGFLLWAATSATLQQDVGAVDQILDRMNRPVRLRDRLKSVALRICVRIPGLPHLIAAIYLQGLRLKLRRHSK